MISEPITMYITTGVKTQRSEDRESFEAKVAEAQNFLARWKKYRVTQQLSIQKHDNYSFVCRDPIALGDSDVVRVR